MKVFCGQCRQVVGKVADEKIPLDKSVKVRCPKCNGFIDLKREDPRDISDFLQAEETPPAGQSQPSDGAPLPPATGPRSYKPEFTGSGREYFRIWIVNTFLSIITLGIYAAWAKVRTRRYFYAHTKLDGYGFDYLADPIAILKGNLIIGGGFILYTSMQQIYIPVSLAIGLLFALMFPWLVYKSLRFFAHNSSYRNIRFRFMGNLTDSYKTYLLLPLTIPFTFGFIFPYWEFKRKQYFFDNFAFGKSRNSFAGTPNIFYIIFIKAYFIIAVPAGLLFYLGFFASIATVMQPTASPAEQSPELGMAFWAVLAVSYVAMLILGTLMQQYLFGRLTNYCWNESSLGSIRFHSTMQVRKLCWIQVTNILGIIATLGLYTPWAKVRRMAYILENIELQSDHGLDRFAAATEDEESAYGDAATDFFDLEIGL